uniref:Ig-like domain-containing protein n=1 Tax=Lates calcarifer TaxID=8187 RepID=A0A4W6CX04_LATCA
LTITKGLTSLLCVSGCISVSESQTVEVQSGEEATLLCSNFTTSPSQIIWFRLTNRTQPRCISSIYTATDPASLSSFCDGFQNGKYEMSSNITTISLKIKQVDVSDSGLYLCGFYMSGHTRLTVTDLNVQGKIEVLSFFWRLMILGAVTVFLVMVVIGLAVKYRKRETAHNEEEHSPQKQNPVSDDLNYAALSFQSKAKRKRRPPSERELEPNVVYAATR